ncbi:hypothetical protein Tco_0540439 [Tanacetum coccineum]
MEGGRPTLSFILAHWKLKKNLLGLHEITLAWDLACVRHLRRKVSKILLKVSIPCLFRSSLTWALDEPSLWISQQLLVHEEGLPLYDRSMRTME